MKAFVLHEDMTPEDYMVIGPDEIVEELALEQEDKDEARRAAMANTSPR